MLWSYIAPQRVRSGDLALPRALEWEEILDLNLQRLARVLDFQTTVAFVGSGPSNSLHYPSWKELLPDPAKHKGCESQLRTVKAALENGAIDAPSALQIAQQIIRSGERNETTPIGILSGDRCAESDKGRELTLTTLRENFNGDRTMAVGQHNPIEALLRLPIRRFVTTNYDLELERALQKKHGELGWQARKSFSQNEREKLAIFGVALAPANRNMVFHCHGKLHEIASDKDPAKWKYEVPRSEAESRTLVITDDDYKDWYLSDALDASAFRDAFDVLLQSNPLFFIGYSLSDADVVRFLRQLSVRQAPRRLASNIFVLTGWRQGKNRLRKDHRELSWKAEEFKYGINVIPFELPNKAAGQGMDNTLANQLDAIQKTYQEARLKWRSQPRAREIKRGAVYSIERSSELFKTDRLKRDRILSAIDQALEREGIAVLKGPFGSGKYLKVCQFHQLFADKYQSIIFSAHGNEDIYSYLRRVVAEVRSCGVADGLVQTGSVVDRLTDILSVPRRKPLLLILSGIDRYLDCTLPEKLPNAIGGTQPEGSHKDNGHYWYARNRIARELLDLLHKRSESVPKGTGRLLLTMQSVPKELVSDKQIISIHQPGRVSNEPFPAEQLVLTPLEFNRLRWELPGDYSALIIAAAHLRGLKPSARDAGLEELMTVLGAASSERGSRVVRYVIRKVDAHAARRFESLLTLLSCFNRPFGREVLDECVRWAKLDDKCHQALIRNGLLEAIQDQSASSRRYVVPPLVKRYCRTIVSGRNQVENRSFGLHGYISRGPFPDPGTRDPKPARELFNRFANRAFEALEELDREPKREKLRYWRGKISQAQAKNRSYGEEEEQLRNLTREARWLIRATVEILRTNFACNSVPRWGRFSDYIEMCSFCWDLIKNLSLCLNDTWRAGDTRHTSRLAPATLDEIIWILNELGLAYYSEGSIQDAISLWGVAFEWQKVLEATEYDQAVMYAATLFCHLGTAHMHLGRMETAREYFMKALTFAKASENRDLQIRLFGYLARIDHFQGSIKEAYSAYSEVVEQLGYVGNRRAQSYFMRHFASLMIRLRELPKAEQMVRESMALAASGDHPDFIAYARELLGKIYHQDNKPREALREFRVALDEARRLGILRLETDVLLGIAAVQRKLGDASAARQRAFEALKLANECLLVQRQIKALIIIGQATSEMGDLILGRQYLEDAKMLSASSEFRLAERDAEGALAELVTLPTSHSS